MALTSQGISTPKIHIKEFLNIAQTDFKDVAKHTQGQANTMHYLTLAMHVQKMSHNCAQMLTLKLIDELESIRHQFYNAAEIVKSSAFQLHLLQQAIKTHSFISQLRREHSHD